LVTKNLRPAVQKREGARERTTIDGKKASQDKKKMGKTDRRTPKLGENDSKSDGLTKIDLQATFISICAWGWEVMSEKAKRDLG